MLWIENLFFSEEDAKGFYGELWLPARPKPFHFFSRLRDAWAVLTHRAEAVQWPDQRGLVGSLNEVAVPTLRPFLGEPGGQRHKVQPYRFIAPIVPSNPTFTRYLD